MGTTPDFVPFCLRVYSILILTKINTFMIRDPRTSSALITHGITLAVLTTQLHFLSRHWATQHSPALSDRWAWSIDAIFSSLPHWRMSQFCRVSENLHSTLREQCDPADSLILGSWDNIIVITWCRKYHCCFSHTDNYVSSNCQFQFMFVYNMRKKQYWLCFLKLKYLHTIADWYCASTGVKTASHGFWQLP